MSESLINFFRKHNLSKDFYIYFNVDENSDKKYSPIYENNNEYKYYIPLCEPINQYNRIVISANAAKYIDDNLGNIDLNRLRVSFYPWPEISLMNEVNYRRRIHDEFDSIHGVLIRFDFRGDYSFYNLVPTYKTLNFLGIKRCVDYEIEYPKRYNVEVMSRAEALLVDFDKNIIPNEAVLIATRKGRRKYKLGKAEFVYDEWLLQYDDILSFIEHLPQQDLKWLEGHQFYFVADFSGSRSSAPSLSIKIVLANNENDERVSLYRSGVHTTHPSITIEKRVLSVYSEIGYVWEPQDGHDYWGSIKKIFAELGDRFKSPEIPGS